jgi:uncharacterized YigZ family protein
LKTLLAAAELRLEIKHSRFIAHAGRTDNLQDTLDFFDRVRDASANHNCWAFRIGQTYRFSDDGEPASTAGKPILAAIDGLGMDHTMVVVTRYFGGIKLGVGGLIRAYGGITSRCLQQAECIEELPRVELQVDVPFDSVGVVHQLLNADSVIKIAEDYREQSVRFKLSVQENTLEKFRQSIADLTSGKAVMRKLLDTA